MRIGIVFFCLSGSGSGSGWAIGHQHGNSDLDRHQNDADAKHCIYVYMICAVGLHGKSLADFMLLEKDSNQMIRKDAW